MDGYTDEHWTVAAQAAKEEKRKREELKELLAEKKRRHGVSSYLLDRCFDQQRAFITDPKRSKSLLGSRRSGKSFALALYLLHEAFKKPRTEVIFVSLARDSARRNFFEKILKPLGQDLKDDLGIILKFNHNTMTVTLPNGSHLYVVSSDASEAEKHKLRGLPYALVVIDEAQDFRTDLRSTVEDVLGPGMVDQAGTICLSGTPNNNTKSFFHDVTNTFPPKYPEFSRHGWKGEENPHISARFIEDKAAKIAANPLIVNDPAYRQEWEGEWVISPDALCYRYSRLLNYQETIPANVQDFHCVMGIDMGWDDPSAIVVAGYVAGNPVLYILDVWTESSCDLTKLSNMIRLYQSRYHVIRMVIDNQQKQGVEEMKRRMGLPLYAAQKGNSKTLKCDYISMLNSDLISGRIKLVGVPSHGLQEEWETLIWDPRSDRMREDPSCANHASDATLYAWLASKNYLEKPKPKPAAYGSPAWIEEQGDKLERKVLADRHKQWWERDK